MKLTIQPLTYSEACAFVERHHRHHKAPQGHKFSIGLNDGERVVGCVMIGRPVARHYDDGYTAEVTRCCVLDGIKNGCSKLYAAAWRTARGMSYRRIITYVLASESGTSVVAAGWKELHRTQGDSWNRKSRPRVDKHPTGPKTLFEQTVPTQKQK